MSQKAKPRPPAPDRPLPVPVIDNHCHLDFEDPADVAELLAHARKVGVERTIQIGCHVEAAERTIELIDEFDQLAGAVAIHPNDAAELATRGELDAALECIEELAQHPKIVAISETGLDFFRTDGADEQATRGQERSFRWHLDLARRLGKPLQIHNREADEATLRVLDSSELPSAVVMHCFSSDAVMARECLERGLYLSFAGNMTFKNAEPLRQALLEVPLDRTLVETDAPFLTPMPHRGKPNASYLVPHTVQMMADVRDVPVQAVCEGIAAASEAVYGTW